MKPIFCVLALFTTLAPALAQDAATAPVAASQTVAKSVTLDNGLVVTPVVVPADDVANILGIKLWRFKIAAPKSGLWVTARLELRKPGAEPEVLDKLSSDAFKKSEYTLGLMPLGDQDLQSAKNIRFYQTNRPLDIFPEQAFGSGSSQGDRANPWLDSKASGYSTSPGQADKDGTIELLTFRGDNPDAQLVLVLTTEPNPFDETDENTK